MNFCITIIILYCERKRARLLRQSWNLEQAVLVTSDNQSSFILFKFRKLCRWVWIHDVNIQHQFIFKVNYTL